MRKAARIFAGPGMAIAGINHFVNPWMYRPLMPDYLPMHDELIYASGVTELAAGVGSMIPAAKPFARWLGIATLVAVFPANVEMVRKPERFKKVPRAASIARLPLQVWMIWAVWDATKPDAEAPTA